MKMNGVLYLYRDEFKRFAWESMCEAHNLPPDTQVIRVVYNEISGDGE
jgi:hypothetical protein